MATLHVRTKDVKFGNLLECDFLHTDLFTVTELTVSKLMIFMFFVLTVSISHSSKLENTGYSALPSPLRLMQRACSHG